MLNKTTIAIIMLLLYVVSWTGSVRANVSNYQTYKYSSAKVIDGDTFIATDGNIKFSVRIVGMDAPEKSQTYGKLATNKLKALIENQSIQINPVGNGRDKYGRTLGQVFIKGQDIALTMIKEGLAYYYRPKCRDYPADKNIYDYNPVPYVEAEVKAKQAKLYIWSNLAGVKACEYRKNMR